MTMKIERIWNIVVNPDQQLSWSWFQLKITLVYKKKKETGSTNLDVFKMNEH